MDSSERKNDDEERRERRRRAGRRKVEFVSIEEADRIMADKMRRSESGSGFVSRHGSGRRRGGRRSW